MSQLPSQAELTNALSNAFFDSKFKLRDLRRDRVRLAEYLTFGGQEGQLRRSREVFRIRSPCQLFRFVTSGNARGFPVILGSDQTVIARRMSKRTHFQRRGRISLREVRECPRSKTCKTHSKQMSHVKFTVENSIQLRLNWKGDPYERNSFHLEVE